MSDLDEDDDERFFRSDLGPDDGPGMHPEFLLRTLDAQARAARENQQHQRQQRLFTTVDDEDDAHDAHDHDGRPPFAHSRVDNDDDMDGTDDADAALYGTSPSAGHLLFSGFMRRSSDDAFDDDAPTVQASNENTSEGPHAMYTDILLRLDAPAFPSNLTASSINDPTEIADPIDTLNGTADPPSPHVNMFTEDAPERPDDDGDEEDDDDAAEGAVEEEDESEGQNVDDSERENTAITVYKSDHPDHQQKLKNGREVTELEATWAVSTFRPDWGVEKMRDNNPLTYWQSDCSNPKAPHTIDLFFTQATVIQQVSIFIDYYQDESYCPKHITIRGGNTYRDLCDIVEVECPEMVGWKNMDLSEILDEPVRVFQLQISINSTHLNGRDTHVRQLKVYSTPSPRFQLPDKANAAADGRLPLTMSMKGLR